MTNTNEPIFARLQAESPVWEIPDCHQLDSELASRATWQNQYTKMSDYLLIYKPGEMNGIPEALLASDPVHLTLVIFLAYTARIAAYPVASVLAQVRAYARKLAPSLNRLRNLDVVIQVHNCDANQRVLEGILRIKRLLNRPSQWPPGTSIALQNLEEVHGGLTVVSAV